MSGVKIHNDDCDEILVDGFCHRCGIAPDMQSVAIMNREAVASRHELRERVRELEEMLDVAADERRGFNAKVVALETRQQELLDLVARLSQSTPLASELEGWESARRALVAEVGTLRARVAELERKVSESQRWFVDGRR